MTIFRSRSCKNVTVWRNGFTHNFHTPREHILCGNSFIYSGIGLSCERTASAIQALNSFSDEENQVCCEVLILQGDARSSRNRILRLKVSPFVGRKRELTLIKRRLCSSDNIQSRTVVVFGAAGVGKSYLANKVVHELRSDFKKQRWIICSGEDELHEDMSSILLKDHMAVKYEIDRPELAQRMS